MSISEPARPAGPHPAASGLVAVILRLTLGLSLLDDGITHYLIGGPGGPRFNPYFGPFSPNPAGLPNFPGWEDFTRLLPYLEIIVGVALILGFFTTVAASAAALWPLLLRVMKVAFVLIAGPAEPNIVMSLAPVGMYQQATLPLLLMALALIWLASSGTNPFSLDALMRRRSAVADEPAGPASKITGGTIPGVPAVGAVNPLPRPFDPGLGLDETMRDG
jgi:uncharacterized membrane protein YphA (DoxX/SURF4 family)